MAVGREQQMTTDTHAASEPCCVGVQAAAGACVTSSAALPSSLLWLANDTINRPPNARCRNQEFAETLGGLTEPVDASAAGAKRLPRIRCKTAGPSAEGAPGWANGSPSTRRTGHLHRQFTPTGT
jgi:hypothetical protein